MKELTIEQKAKRYDKIIEMLRSLHDDYDIVSTLIDIKEELENILPELKNEDERIRKSLINYVYCHGDAGDFTKEEFIAWLEKQGEQKPDETIKWSPQEESCICQLESLVKEQWRHAERVHNSVNIKKMLELMFFLKTINPNKKPTNKVEPKFHEGDWIVFNGLTLHVKEVVKGFYRTISIDGIPNSYDWDIDKIARLWTIQNAKDGDVLAYGDQLFLFKKMNTSNSFYAYCNYHFIGHDSLSIYDCSYSIDNIYPATKKQCNLLFQKIKEAGYEWNDEKKELRKINKKPAEWSEEDEAKLKSACALIRNTSLNGNEGIVDSTVTFLKSLKARVQPKQERSEEDEDTIKFLISHFCVSHCNRSFQFTSNKLITHDELLEKIRNLRPQKQWKPSDRQMLAIYTSINIVGKDTINGKYLIELAEQLKKLRGE